MKRRLRLSQITTPITSPEGPSAQSPRILVFDSGVGGLSIAQAIQEQHSHCTIIYASDNDAFPYGTKTEDFLIERVDQVLYQLQIASEADIIVVACNSASTIALPKIRERFNLPIIGVVPAIKPAAQTSKTKVIGLLATPGTIERKYTANLIYDYANDCKIVPVGSSELVLIAENKLKGIAVSLDDMEAIIRPFKENPNIDTIVLACTHFPLLKEELQTLLPTITCWVDSSEAIGRRVGHFLNELQLPLDPSQKVTHLESVKHTCLFTAPSNIDELETSLKKFNFSKIDIVKPIDER